MRRVAALLRAVNLGSFGKLPMADLKALLVAQGYEAPQTLLASGNAVFGSDLPKADLEAAIEQALVQRQNLSTPVFVRDGADFAAVTAANPFTAMAQSDPNRLLVMFLDADPDETAVAAVRARITGPEEIAAGPRCVYLSYPTGVGTSKLSGALIERLTGRRGTARNWNTTVKLRSLTM